MLHAPTSASAVHSPRPTQERVPFPSWHRWEYKGKRTNLLNIEPDRLKLVDRLSRVSYVFSTRFWIETHHSP